jgi:nitrogen fixation-related uncharacterized protein
MDGGERSIMSATRAAILLLVLLAALLWACAHNGDDDNDDAGHSPSDDDASPDDDDASPSDDDDDTGQPIGACVCCFLADGQAWGYCWAVGFADECEPGCRLLYDDAHFLDAIFTPDAHCLDLDADAMCRQKP